MSSITNIILTYSLGNHAEKINEVNDFEYRGLKLNLVSVSDNKLPNAWYGGSKYLTSYILIGAFNNIDLIKLVKHLRNIKWEDPEDVQLIVKEEKDERFRIINVFDEFPS